MNTTLLMIISLAVLAACIAIKLFTRRKLDNIEGVRGVTTKGDIEAARTGRK